MVRNFEKKPGKNYLLHIPISSCIKRVSYHFDSFSTMFSNVTCHDIIHHMSSRLRLVHLKTINVNKTIKSFLPTDERRTKLTTLPYIPKRKIRYDYANIDKRKDFLYYQLHKQKEKLEYYLPVTPGSPCGPVGPEKSKREE